MARVLPYWHDAVVPQLRAGLVPLVVAHGNSLRALAKHLEGISDAEIAELNIPTGVPRRYDLDDDLEVVRVPATWAMPRPWPPPQRRSRSKRARDHGESLPGPEMPCCPPIRRPSLPVPPRRSLSSSRRAIRRVDLSLACR